MVPGVVYSKHERPYIRRWNIDSGSAFDLPLEESVVHTLLAKVYALVRSTSLVFSGMLLGFILGAQASKEWEC